VHQVAHWLRLY